MSNQQIIKQCDPQASYLAHREEIDAVIRRVLDSGSYILGHEVNSFETEFAQYLGVDHVIGVASGTDALALSLKALGIGHGDHVLAPSHTAVATVAAIEIAGATPILLDVDPETFVIEPEILSDALNILEKNYGQEFRKIKALLIVHLYGLPADMPALKRICERYDLKIVEDCAQATGAAFDDRKVGSWGDIGAFSFYPTKNLGAIGDGGAIATNNDKLAHKVRLLRQYGWEERYVSKIPGFNSRLDEIQAAILRIKLKNLDEDNERRQGIAKTYTADLGRLAENIQYSTLCIPVVPSNRSHVFHQFVIQSNDRDELRHYLNSNSVLTAIHYPLPVHMQSAYTNRSILAQPSLPGTDALSKRILSLPIYPEMPDEHIDAVTNLVKNFCLSNR